MIHKSMILVLTMIVAAAAHETATPPPPHLRRLLLPDDWELVEAPKIITEDLGVLRKDIGLIYGNTGSDVYYWFGGEWKESSKTYEAFSTLPELTDLSGVKPGLNPFTETFDGAWYWDETRLVVDTGAGLVTSDTGDQMKVQIQNGKLLLTIGGDTLLAERRGSDLVWDNGITWVPKQTEIFDGAWYWDDMRFVVDTGAGLVTSNTGDQMEVQIQNGKLLLTMSGGDTLSAERRGSRSDLVWDNGITWVRKQTVQRTMEDFEGKWGRIGADGGFKIEHGAMESKDGRTYTVKLRGNILEYMYTGTWSNSDGSMEIDESGKLILTMVNGYKFTYLREAATES